MASVPSRTPHRREVERAAALLKETEAAVGSAHPDAIKAREALGDAHLAAGDFEAAKVAYEEAYLRRVHQSGEDDFWTQRDAIKLSAALRDLGQLERALALQERAAEVLGQIDGPIAAVWVAMEHQRETLVRLGRLSDAVGVQEAIADQKCSMLGYQVEAVRSLRILGQLRSDAGDPAGAKATFTRAAQMAETVDMPLRMRLDLNRARLELAMQQRDYPVVAETIAILLDRYEELSREDELRQFIQRRKPFYKVLLKSARAQVAKQTGS
jgi:tetratricopeptide (TPR) repeat protein